jgi:hypothetical protein
VWSAIGLVLLVDGPHAMDDFPLLWFANDVALFLALLGFVMHVLRGEPSPRPKVDEWAGWDPSGELDLPLEGLLARMAASAQAEWRRP